MTIAASLTAEDIKKELRRLAALHPDAVYSNDDGQCYYTRGTAGGGYGCIFGQAIINLVGDSAKGQLIAMDGVLSVPRAGGMLYRLGVSLNNEDVGLFSELQWLQDHNVPWGEAVRRTIGEA